MSEDDKGTLRLDLAFPSDEHFELHEWPFYWLIKAYGEYINNLETTLKTVGLDVPRWRVLMLLESDKARSVSFLATEAITKLSTMTRIVQRMQEDGLVVSRPRESDQRVTEVLLTESGYKARQLAVKQAESIYTRSFEGFSMAEITSLNKTLQALIKNLK